MTALSDEELEARYLSDHRPEPWVAVNMVSSVDGGTAIAGRSSAIGDHQDRVVFRALRAIADLVLVAAATVRAEGYGPASLPEHLERWRVERDKPPRPRVAIVSRSLDFDVDAFGDEPPIVITSQSSPDERRSELEDRTDVLLVGSEQVDLGEALDRLRERGGATILCEGGPALNGQLAAHDLVDEWCLTIAPLVLSGDSHRIVRGDGLSEGRPLRLDRALRGEQALFTRWLRADG